MNEKQARSILDGIINESDNSILSHDLDYLSWAPGNDEICLDGRFTIHHLKAIIWWMKNKNVPTSA